MSTYERILRLLAAQELVCAEIALHLDATLACVRNRVSLGVQAGHISGTKVRSTSKEKRYTTTLAGRGEIDRLRERREHPPKQVQRDRPKAWKPPSLMRVQYAESHARHIALQVLLGIDPKLIHGELLDPVSPAVRA